MHVAILYNTPGTVRPDDEDILDQVRVITQGLDARGHTWAEVPCGLDLKRVREHLAQIAPDTVINLVESLDGIDRLAPLAPALLDALGLPYTGCGAAAMAATNDKLAMKRQLRHAGLDTPDWFSSGDTGPCAPGRYIIKTRYEHASIGMTDESVVTVKGACDLQARIDTHQREVGREMFAERFVAGREFNLSVIEDAQGGAQVLPAAEIDFSAFPADKPRIVNYAAKWDPQAFEFSATPRTFEFPASDTALLKRLRELAARCWTQLGLRGYVRVDFRVDEQGRPWVLEVNTNPCLSADAGFAAAWHHAGHPWADAVQRLLDRARCE